MSAPLTRISTANLVRSLGNWRRHGSRHGAADLAAAIRMLVLDGSLPAGTLLPAEREVATGLEVSRTMVGTAWEMLRTDGLVRSRRGAGSWTALPVGAGARPADPLPVDGVLELTRAAPAAIPGIASATEAVLPRLAEELAGHGYYEYGLPELRDRIAARFTARGVPTERDGVLVTVGGQHAFALVLRHFVGPGDRVLVESPTYPNAVDAITAVQARPVPVLMRDDGWDLGGLDATLRQAGPRLAYLIPDFHNPTGLRLSAAGREELVGTLRRARTPLVVDETLIELDLDGVGDAPPPVAALADDLVITVGSAAKSHWGGLRLGWIRARPEVIHRLAAARTAIDLGSPVLDQLVLARLMLDDGVTLRQRRAELALARDTAVAALAEHCPDWTCRVPAGGLSLWCRLPRPVSTRIAAVAPRFGVRVAPGARFGVHGGLESWLRVPYTLPIPQLIDAVVRLGMAAALVSDSAEPGVDGRVPIS